MIVEYIRYKISEERRQELEMAYSKAMEALAASPHCLRCEVSYCVEDATQYIIRIEWDSIDGHLQGFRQSPDFQKFLKHVGGFFNNIEEMRHYEVVQLNELA